MRKNNRTMKRKYTIFFTLAAVFVLLTQNLLAQKKIGKDSCAKNKGYWYNNKCWENFEDESISANDIDRFVEEQIKIINKARVQIDGKKYPIKEIDFSTDDDDENFFFTIKAANTDKNLVVIINVGDFDRKQKFNAHGFIYTGDKKLDEKIFKKAKYSKLKVIKKDRTSFVIRVTGKLENPETGKKIKVSSEINEVVISGGKSVLEIKGSEVFLSGVLGAITYKQIKDLITNHPKVKTLVLTDVPGSMNDAVNVHTGRLVRNAGLNTKALKNSKIHSGGVDLLAAGNERIVEEGAEIGVHTWCCVNDKPAVDLPKDHPAHRNLISYLTEMLGAKKGVDFYFYTLQAAPHSNVHKMSKKEIIDWNLATTFIEAKKNIINK